MNDSGNWRSRKAKMAVASLAIPWVFATLGWLVLGKMEAAQWVSFCQWTIPLVLLVYSGANVAEKIGTKGKNER